MKTKINIIAIICCLFLISACGYRNANIYDGPEKKIYINNWQNRTNKLTLNSDVYRSLNLWFQKSQSIQLVSDKKDADLILAGEIVDIALPSLSFSDQTTSEVRVVLSVRYVIKDLTNNTIFIQAPHSIWTEEYTPSESSSSASKENKALEQIVDDLSKDIYQKTLKKLNSL